MTPPSRDPATAPSPGGGEDSFADCTLRERRAQAPVAGEPFHEWDPAEGMRSAVFYRVDGGYLIRFFERADFFVSEDGRKAVCWPVPDRPDANWQHLYLNQIRPLMRSKQGTLAFHASAVEVGAGAIAFIAPSRHGKSTLAAALASAGHRYLTDDGLNVEDTEDGFVVLPDHPSIRLWEDSRIELTGAGVSDRPGAGPGLRPKANLVGHARLPFCPEPRPLLAAYFLGEGTAADVTFARLSSRETMFRLLTHSFVLDIEDRVLLSRQFEGVTRLVDAVPGFELDYPRRYGELPRVREAILAHAAGLSG